MEIEKCNCRFQLGDYGYYECCLDKNHIGNHKYNEDKTSENNWRKRSYSIEWERDDKKDIIINLEWIKENTNLEEISNKIIDKYYFLSSFIISETFEDAIHGSSFSCDISFSIKEEVKEKYNLEDYENYLNFIKEYCDDGETNEYYDFKYQLLREITNQLNIKEEDYDLDLFVNIVDYY